MSAPKAITATCHCKGHDFPIDLSSASLPIKVDYCYCNACRTSTGSPFAVYLPIPHPLFSPTSTPDGITGYATTQHCTRYFCSTCGCHLALLFVAGNKWFTPIGCLQFGSSSPLTIEEERAAVDATYQVKWHQFLSETVDGGLSRLMHSDGLPRYQLRPNSAPFVPPPTPGPVNNSFRRSNTGEDILTARCRCGGVRAVIRRPCAIPDGPGAKKEGSKDGQRWLAGNCMCSDCRLTSGFPISSWIYVGREHLTFEEAEEGMLRTYQSSEKAKRGFCRRCGASVTWDGGLDNVDVATALVERDEGEGVAGLEENWMFLEELVYPEDARDAGLLAAMQTGMSEVVGKGC